MRQLLPVHKKQVDIMSCETHRSVADKAHKHSGFEFHPDKKQVDILVKFKVTW